MPYIKRDRREQLIGAGSDDLPNTPGELNYVITEFISEYVIRKGKSYQAINDVIGALEGAKLEFYRRVAAPYEDQKILENGDVYE